MLLVFWISSISNGLLVFFTLPQWSLQQVSKALLQLLLFSSKPQKSQTWERPGTPFGNSNL